MEFIATLLIAAAVFGICFLVDKGFAKAFRSKAQHRSGLAVRASKRYGIFGVMFSVLGILGVVGVNGIFLFWPEVSVYSLLDYSICGYSLTAFLMYWCCFNYSTHGMLNRLKTSMEK